MRNALVVGGAVFVFAIVMLLPGCSVSFTTAHITSFTISKDKEGSHPASSFAPSEAIYAKVAVGNVPGKVTLKWRTVAEKVTGVAEHSPLPDFNVDYELKGDGTSTYTLTPSPSGWPAGTYVIQVSMLDDSGAEKDKRSGNFTVAGAAANTPASQPRPESGSDAHAAKPELSEPVFAASKGGEAVDSFAPDAPEIFMHSEFTGVPVGSKITATWIAEKVDGVDPETRITSSDVTIGSTTDNVVDFSVTKPKKDWPPGTYRVDVSLNGKVITSGHFDVEE